MDLLRTAFEPALICGPNVVHEDMTKQMFSNHTTFEKKELNHSTNYIFKLGNKMQDNRFFVRIHSL